MSRKLILIFAITLAVILFLTACERSAVVPQSQATATEDMGPDQPTVGLPDAYKTQTIAAAHTALALTMQPGAPSTTGASPTPTNTRYWDLTVTPTTSIVLPTTPAVIATAPTPTVGRPATYTLQSGDFPYCIARRFDVNPDDLMSLNHLTDGMILQPGLVLNIPQTGSFPGTRALRTHPTTYTVQLDDTIYKIACLFGDVDPIYMAAYNGIVPPYTLTTGKILNIP